MSSDIIANFYSQEGSGLPFFVGKQYGSGWLRNVARIAFPILKRVARVGSKVASDMLYQNKDFKSSFKDNALGAVSGIVGSLLSSRGGGEAPQQQQPSSPDSTTTTGINRSEVSRKRTFNHHHYQPPPVLQSSTKSKRRRRK